jgi:hypothetical protein
VDAREHRPHEGAAPADWDQLRLGPRDRHLPARLLQVEPVAVRADAGTWPGLPEAIERQLVPELQHRAGQRAGGGRGMLALPHAGDHPGSRAVVLPDHRLRRRAARCDRASEGMAREGSDDAAELDRPVRGGSRSI